MLNARRATQVVGSKSICDMAIGSAGTDDLKHDPSAITFFKFGK